MGLMTSRDYHNYLGIFQSIIQFVKQPDLLIYLKASVPTLVSNIQRRGREYEKGIRLDYLNRRNEKYENWIGGYREGRLLVVDQDKDRKSVVLGKSVYSVDVDGGRVHNKKHKRNLEEH